MLFNSIQFALFLILTFVIYWSLKSKFGKFQNLFLLLSSFVFYSFWDWRFMFLLLFSITLDYLLGIKIQDARTHSIKRIWLW